MPPRNKWSSTARARRCSVATAIGGPRPLRRGFTPVPERTSGSPLPSPVTINGGPYGRCWAIPPGRGAKSWQTPKAGTLRTTSSTVSSLRGPASAQPRHPPRCFSTSGIPSAVVVPPREIVANPQLRYRGLFEVEEHAVTGAHEIPTLPFRFSRVDRWLKSPAPTLGRDNDAVLEDLGYSPAAIEELRQSGLVGEVPAGL